MSPNQLHLTDVLSLDVEPRGQASKAAIDSIPTQAQEDNEPHINHLSVARNTWPNPDNPPDFVFELKDRTKYTEVLLAVQATRQTPSGTKRYRKLVERV